MSRDLRNTPRTRLRAEVKVSHPNAGEIRTHTRDISDSGAFVFADGHDIALGDVVEVQVQGLPGGDAPVVRMRIVRLDKEGMGLEFVLD
jgi:ribosomal protein S12